MPGETEDASGSELGSAPTSMPLPESAPAALPEASAPPPSRKSDRPSLRAGSRQGGAASLLGTEIGGRYRIDSVLGEGGMGTVYAAEHLLMRKRVALKVLHPEMSRVPDVVARFEREAMAAGHIDHPNIAAATDFGKLGDGSFFLVLELVVGENLREVIARGPMEVGRAIHIADQIVAALVRAHGLGVVHRDLKPDNVMLITRGSDPDFVKVLDFGIAKVPILEPTDPPSHAHAPSSLPLSGPAKPLTKAGMIYGTPDYMAPEQALGQTVDGRADLYAVGIILFEMLTGKRPFVHENMATLLGLHIAAPVPSMVDVAPSVAVPLAVEAVVRRLLAKDPAQRFATAEELAQALAVSTAVTLPSEPAPLPARGDAARALAVVVGSKKARTYLAAGAGVGLLLAIGVVALTRSHGTDAPVPPDPAPRATAVSPPRVEPAPRAEPTPPPAVTPPPARPESPSDPLASVLLAADSALARNDGAFVIATVAPLEGANAARPDVHRVLERAYAMTGDRTSALHEAEALLTLDPTASANLDLQKDLGEIATHPGSSNAAILLLANRMDTPGVDILYDLGYASQQIPSVARRARLTLAQASVRAHAGPAAGILLDLRDAPTCEARKALLPRVKADADRRAVPLLAGLAATRGGGCLRNDPAYLDAVAVVKARAGVP